MKYIHVENGILNGCGEAEQLGENVLNIEVSDDIYNAYLQEPYKYIYSNNSIIENPNYETEKQKLAIKTRIDEIYRNLDALDLKRIRAVCESEVKDARSGETWLNYYNSQIIDLRAELNALEAQV